MELETAASPDQQRRLPQSARRALAILIPPISILILGFFGWLWVGGRKRAGEKYAGLRTLSK